MAKAAKKGASAKKVGKKSNRKPKRSYAVYIRRVLKSQKSKLTLSGRTMKVVNSFVTDMLDRIATEAGALCRVNKKRTLGSREIQTAVRLTLPAELAKVSLGQAARTLSKASN